MKTRIYAAPAVKGLGQEGNSDSLHGDLYCSLAFPRLFMLDENK